MTVLDATTRLTCVLGHPVDHSLSPAIHNAAFRHDGRNACYLAFDVAPGAVEAAVEGLAALGAVGCNVTLPHKADAFAAARVRSDEAERVGAANTLVFAPEGIEAHNTDVAGVLGALEELGLDVAGERVLVLGAGGAGRAAAWAVAASGAEAVLIANRTATRAEALVDALRRGGHEAHAVPWASRAEGVAQAGCLINATAVGLGGDGLPVPESALLEGASDACRAVLDLVYSTDETPLTRAARGAGLLAADGLGMLVRQAAASYRLFWGAEPPIEAMREAAHRTTGRHQGKRDGGPVPPIV